MPKLSAILKEDVFSIPCVHAELVNRAIDELTPDVVQSFHVWFVEKSKYFMERGKYMRTSPTGIRKKEVPFKEVYSDFLIYYKFSKNHDKS